MINVAHLTITDPHHWDKDALFKNLQAAVDVELWTIPLYLTALYSIEGLDTSQQADYPVVAKLIESVVIEEMLHLQLACNICNALGYPPQMHVPVYSEAEGIPFIKTSIPHKYHGYTVQLGGLTVNQLKLFCIIELPEPDIAPNWSKQTKYNSIGELYQALEIAIGHLWPTLYVGDENNTKQQANFTDYLNKYNAHPHDGFSQIVTSLDTALAALQAIVGQGEGNTRKEIPPIDQPPPMASQDYDPSDYDPAESHFLKFNRVLDQLLRNNDVPRVYPVIEHPTREQRTLQAAANSALQQQFTLVLSELQRGFNMPQKTNMLPEPFWTDMAAMQDRIAAVWKAGAVPIFTASAAEHQQTGPLVS